jgi:hypothetical protein
VGAWYDVRGLAREQGKVGFGLGPHVFDPGGIGRNRSIDPRPVLQAPAVEKGADIAHDPIIETGPGVHRIVPALAVRA